VSRPAPPMRLQLWQWSILSFVPERLQMWTCSDGSEVRSAGDIGLRLGLVPFAQDSARIAAEILYPVP
jgi:hypothetical protein